MRARNETKRRGSGFHIRTALLLAVLAHLLTYMAIDRQWAFVLPVAPEKPPEPPLRFVFAETPKSPEPPPATRLIAAEQHRAQTPEPDPTASVEVAARAVQASLAPAQQPVPVAPPPPRPQPSVAKPPPSPPPPATTMDTTTLAQMTPPPVPVAQSPPAPAPRPQPLSRSISESAIGQTIQAQLPAQREGAANVPQGVMDFDAKDFEWGPYAQRIYKIIERNWHSELQQRVSPGIEGMSRLRFRIDRSGRITGLELLLDSRWRVLDVAALGSIELSNPLPQLPVDYPHEDVGLTFSYYYNMPPAQAD